MTLMQKLSVFLTALAAAGLAWSIGTVILNLAREWQERMLEETELELEEMLLMLDAKQIMNLGISAAVACGALTFLVVGGLGSGWNAQAGAAVALPVVVALLFFPRILLKVLRARRLERFNDQLEEALMSMSNSLKAGFSIQQAIEMVIKQKRQPISLEFKLMMEQTRLGASMDEALHNMAQRVKSDDLSLVCSAISTARTTGGDLTGILERLAQMIRERLRIQRRVRSLTAQGRLQGFILGMMPLLLLGVLMVITPDVVKSFFGQPLGILLLLVVVFLEACGFFVIRKIVTIDI